MTRRELLKKRWKKHECTDEEKKKLRLRRMIFRTLFFILVIPVLEIVLRAADSSTTFFSLGLWRSFFAGAGLGVLLLLIGTLIPRKDISRVVVAVLLLIISAFFVVERCCRAFFGVYYQIEYLFRMSGQVAGEFMGTVGSVILRNLWFFVLALVPFVLFLVFWKKLIPRCRRFRPARIVRQSALLVFFWAIAILLCNVGNDVNYVAMDYTANSTVPRFGLVNTMRMEVNNAVFRTSDTALVYEPLDVTNSTTSTGASGTNSVTEDTESIDSTESGTEAEETETAIEYGYNVIDIDFESLIASDTSDTLLAMDQYFSSQEPTQQNEYTGYFEGKNLIFLTAEAFSGYVIDEELTPALYELSTNGFVFTNYYQPDWTQSTTGGEFANMTGLIPTWVSSETSFTASVGNSMPFALGWQFSALGYNVTAWHNNTYTYYGRDETHPNLGYDYYGFGNGLAPDAEPGEVSTAMHVVVFADSGFGNSWITAAGTYEAYTDTFTPDEGVEVSDDYVSLVKKLVQDKYTYAKCIIQEDYYSHVFQ